MSVRVILPDGSVKEYPNGTTQEEILRDNRQAIARSQRPEGYTPLRGGMASLRQGFTFGLSDEAAGAGAAVGQGIRAAVRGQNPLPAMAEGFRSGRAEERGLSDQFGREQPIGSFATQLVGGLGAGAPATLARAGAGSARAAGAMPAAPQRITGPRTAMRAFNAAPRPVTMAAGLGAVGGNTLEERALGGALGAGIGGILHGAAGALAGRARTADDYALDRLQASMREARRDPLFEVSPVVAGARPQQPGPGGITPQSLTSAANRLRTNVPGGNEAMLYEAVPAMYQSMQAIATVGGPGRAILEEAVQNQAQGVSRRVMGAVEGATNEPATSYQALTQRLTGERNQAARQAYERAYAVPLADDQQQILRNLMTAAPDGANPILPQETAFANRALRGAAEIAAQEVRHLRNQIQRAADPTIRAQAQAELSEVLRVAQGFNDLLENASSAAYVSPRTVNYYGRALANIANDVRGDNTGAMALRSQIQDVASEMVPEYRAAQAQYSDDSGALEIAQQAYQAIMSPASQGAAAFRHQMTQGFGGTPAQMRAAALGVLEGLDAKLATGDTRAVLQIIRNRNVQDAIRNAFADGSQTGQARFRAGNQIINRIQLEAQAANRRGRLFGNSATAERAEAVARNTQEEGVVDFAIQAIESGGIIGPLRSLAGRTLRVARNPGVLNPQRNEALARLGTQPLSRAGALQRQLEARQARAKLNALRRAQSNILSGGASGGTIARDTNQ